MLSWSIRSLRKGRQLKAESRALTREELQSVFVEQLACLVSDILPQYDENKWDSIVAGIQLSHGALSLIPCLNADIEKQLPGNTVYLRQIHNSVESIENEELHERYFAEYLQLIVSSMVVALETFQSNHNREPQAPKRQVAFTIITEPEEPELFSKKIEI